MYRYRSILCVHHYLNLAHLFGLKSSILHSSIRIQFKSIHIDSNEIGRIAQFSGIDKVAGRETNRSCGLD